jgi:hypothetical protein
MLNFEQLPTPNPIQPSLTNSLIFVDPATDNYDSLVAAASPQAKVFLLDSARDGIAQISEILARYRDVSSIHIVSHGDSGSLELAKTRLNAQTLADYRDRITGWSSSLTDTADILLYGCKVAEGDGGKAFVRDLADLSQSDVAASIDLTGSQALGGNWKLEYATGAIEADLAFQPEIQDTYGAVLHQELLDLVPTSTATHVAVKSGSWFDPATWQGGKIPNDGARAYIPEGFSVTYDGESAARLKTLRVDGTLQFAADRNTKMVIDTFVVAPAGKLSIGTQSNPIKADKTARIIFTSDSPIDTSWDPTQLSRGLISHGQARIYGANKLDFVTLQGDALAGSKELVLNSTPTGWRVGDQLVLGGTTYNSDGSDSDNSRYQDEVLTIAAINGNRIRFTNNNITVGDNTVLRFDHKLPTGGQDKGLKLYVANTTRNVIFASEGGVQTPLKQRGHLMFMDNPDVEVNNAGFYDLGRTDKSQPIDDVGTNVDGSPGYGTNPRGRYSLHVHRTGIDNKAVIVRGNVIEGSPGWGIAQHSSNAILEDNVVFNIRGAGILAEGGNEIGAWRNNLTLKTLNARSQTGAPQGLDRGSEAVKLFDFGFEGDGYWVQGAGQVEMEGNIAVSADGFGTMIFGGGDNLGGYRDAQTFSVAKLLPELQGIAKGTDNEAAIDVAAVPLRKLSGFESYNSRQGIGIWSTMKNAFDGGQLSFDDIQPAHNFYSRIDNFKLWQIHYIGAAIVYSGQIELDGGLILGQKISRGRGLDLNTGTNKIRLKNLNIENFKEGIEVPTADRDFVASQLENVHFANNQIHLLAASDGGYTPGYPAYFQIDQTTFVSTSSSNALPTPQFNVKAVGGLGVAFDASDSFDSDRSGEPSGLPAKGIVAYGWDFDSDGQIDRFGRTVSYYFGQAGSHNVTLTVWDDQGATKTLTKTVNVSPSAYPNLLSNGDFSSAGVTESFDSLSFSNTAAGRGWFTLGWVRDSKIGSNGAAVFSNPNVNGKGIGQVILDNAIRRGPQSLSLDLKNIEGNSTPNQIIVSVWGINGEFINPGWQVGAPSQVGALPPPQATKLLEQAVGGQTFDWKTFKWNLDFGSGYQFILVKVSDAQNRTIDPSQGDYLALDNVKLISDPGNPPPSQDISYAIATTQSAVTEGNSGSQAITFSITRSGATQSASSVNFAIGGSATNGQDYGSIGGTSGAAGLNGSVNFAAGETSKTLTLNILGDTTFEGDETVSVTLSNPTAPGTASLTAPVATTTIINDDPQPTVAINNVKVIEGSRRSRNAKFTVTLSNASSQAIAVNYATANGTATAGSDYTAISGQLTFNPGETSKTLEVPILSDALLEGNETFFVNLSNASNATFADNQGEGTIINALGQVNNTQGLVAIAAEPAYSRVDPSSDSNAAGSMAMKSNSGRGVAQETDKGVKSAIVNVTSMSLPRFNVGMGEEGLVLDPIILTLDPNFKPL